MTESSQISSINISPRVRNMSLDTIVDAVPISLIGLASCCLFWILLHFACKVLSFLSKPCSRSRDEADVFGMAWFHAVISFSVTYNELYRCSWYGYLCCLKLLCGAVGISVRSRVLPWGSRRSVWHIDATHAVHNSADTRIRTRGCLVCACAIWSLCPFW
jgi:hypothetical protein